MMIDIDLQITNVENFPSNFFIDSSIEIEQNEFDDPVFGTVDIELQGFVPFWIWIPGHVFRFLGSIGSADHLDLDVGIGTVHCNKKKIGFL